MFLSACYIWKVDPHDDKVVTFDQKMEEAGDPATKLKMEMEVFPDRSRQNNEHWTILHFKLTIESSQRPDYHYKARVKVSLYDRRAGRYLCKEKEACHEIEDSKDHVMFFMEDFILQTEVASDVSKELEIYVEATVSSRRVGIMTTDYSYQPPELTCEEESMSGYVKIDRD